MKKSIILLLAIVAIGVVSTGQSAVPQDVCDYVERFKIVDRPVEIALEDVEWIVYLNGFGNSDREALKDYIEANGNITTVSQLDGVDEIGKTSIGTITIFFALEGTPTCEVPSTED